MYYIASISAYDALTTVVVHASVKTRMDELDGRLGVVFDLTTSLDGVGETDPVEWLRDALVQLLEVL